MRFDVVVHKQSLICRRIFQGKRSLAAAVVKRLKKYNGRSGYPLCNYVTLLTVVTFPMLEPPNDEYFMREALRQAQKAYDADEVPVGAVVVRAGKIIARSHNQVELLQDATAHVVMQAVTHDAPAGGDGRLIVRDI